MLASFVDRFEIQDAKPTADGYMAFDARFARSGIYQYRASELGDGGTEIVNVYRPEEAVFDAKSMAGWAHKPLCDNHPQDSVTAANWKDVARGWTGDEVKRDGEFLRIPMMLADAGIIDKYKAGKVELSAGYRAEVTRQDGTAPSGEAYQYVMSDIVPNHIAIVDKGRAGSQCRLGDAWPVEAKDTKTGERTMNTKTILVDGLMVETTDAGEAAITKLQGQIVALNATVAARDKAIADGAAALSTKDGELIAAKVQLDAATLTPERLDAAVLARTAVIDTAKKVLGKDFDGKGLADTAIRKLAVAKLLGDAMPADMNDDAIAGAFKAVETVKIATKDNIAAVVLDGVTAKTAEDATTRAMSARDAMIAGLNGTPAEGNA